MTTRRQVLVAAVALPAAGALPGRIGGPAAVGNDVGARDGRSLMWPVRTTEADWARVAAVLGRAGKLGDLGRVYRVGFPRRDLTVASGGVVVKPALSLGSYAAFGRYRDGQALLMGDLVVTEAELPRVTDAVQAAGLGQTAIHKHLLHHDPDLWWTHVHGLGCAEGLAGGVRAALDRTGTPPPAPPSTTPGELDGAALDAIVGRSGGWDGGVYKSTRSSGQR